jgi:hypothetical protein
MVMRVTDQHEHDEPASGDQLLGRNDARHGADDVTSRAKAPHYCGRVATPENPRARGKRGDGLRRDYSRP